MANAGDLEKMPRMPESRHCLVLFAPLLEFCDDLRLLAARHARIVIQLHREGPLTRGLGLQVAVIGEDRRQGVGVGG